jgi:hypothetical protein
MIKRHNALLGLVSALALSCTYSPDFDNGVLVCGPSASCPKGFSCEHDGVCWKDGANPDGPQSLSKFTGTWIFSGGTSDFQCSESSHVTSSLVGTYISVGRNSAAASLLADYYCQWVFHRDSLDEALVDPGQACEQDTPDTTFNWLGQSFSIVTSDGIAGTASGRLSGPAYNADGTSAVCEIAFSGSLSKTSQ